MFIVGLTGGIGSGKTVVSDYLASLNIDIIDADVCSRMVVAKGQPALVQITKHFGEHILQVNGELNRTALRQKIFQHIDDKTWLETLLHPLINDEILRQIGETRSDYTVLVSPLLTETQQHLMCDRITVVDVDEQTQLQRTIARDDNDAKQVKRIMASQSPRGARLAKAHDVLTNNSTLSALQKNTHQLHLTYLQFSKNKQEVSHGL